MVAKGEGKYVSWAILVFSVISQMLWVVINLTKHRTSSAPQWWKFGPVCCKNILNWQGEVQTYEFHSQGHASVKLPCRLSECGKIYEYFSWCEALSAWTQHDSHPQTWPAQIVFSHFVLHRSRMPLVLTIKIAHLRSLVFRQ